MLREHAAHDIGILARLRGILGHNGRFDFQAPIATAWKLHSLWPGSELVIVSDAGHAAGNPGIRGPRQTLNGRFSTGERLLLSGSNDGSGSFTLICSPVLSGGSTIHNGP
jgi:hypothetical protein